MSNVPNNQLNFPQPPVAGTAHADAIPRINNDLSSLLQFFYDGRLDRDWAIWHMQEYFTAAVQNINWVGDNEAILTPWYQAIDDHERQQLTPPLAPGKLKRPVDKDLPQYQLPDDVLDLQQETNLT
ncbi:hypothetical protein BDZ89DRAFT_1140096 [Hymenopellis radicata]|nr:hypothetical protein BDZ89DRAFT_1140096 [Hymenopellis radicata]